MVTNTRATTSERCICLYRLGCGRGFAGIESAEPEPNASVQRVSPEELKQLRKELSCTAKELANTLGVEPKEIAAWEAGELFPTKRYVSELEALRKQGPTAILKAPKGKGAIPKVGMARLADAKLWELVRKLAEHPALFDQVSKLAEAYPDPAAPAAKPDTVK
jgi:DNA-binding transcriptional regulator YiaG